MVSHITHKFSMQTVNTSDSGVQNGRVKILTLALEPLTGHERGSSTDMHDSDFKRVLENGDTLIYCAFY